MTRPRCPHGSGRSRAGPPVARSPEASLEPIDWIGAGLTALDAGEPLPAPFGDEQTAWQSLWADNRVPRSLMTLPDERPKVNFATDSPIRTWTDYPAKAA
jgi:hypothetical protein